MATIFDPELADRAPAVAPGHGQRSLGPSDSSDGGSDMGPNAPDTDTDSVGTGERIDVEADPETILDRDVEPDRVIDEEDAGLAHTPPDPARNGG